MNRDEAIEKLAEYLNLSEQAISVAEGWSILPPDMRAHFCLMLDDYIARQSPTLEKLYANARRHEQQMFNRVIENVQDRLRHSPPEDPA